MKTNCIVVDDEPLARELITGYIRNIEGLELIGQCSNAIEAFQLIREKKVDLVFLDINMPQISGLEFIRSLSSPPKVIIISAYKEYALEGFELDVVDYLLKPVSFSRLLKAVDKYLMMHTKPVFAETTNQTANDSFIYLKENKKVIKVMLNEIDYIEAMGEYCQVYVEGRRVITKMSIKCFEDSLNENEFIRIHKSIIVPLRKITAFSASTVEINRKKELAIGRSYKVSVLHALQYTEKLQDS
jgi:DNA-binding LytR/AlgR family response regulator